RRWCKTAHASSVSSSTVSWMRYAVETAHIQYQPSLRLGEVARVSCQAGRLSPLSALRNRQERVQARDREDLIDLCVEVGKREPPAKPLHPLMEVDKHTQIVAGDILDLAKVEQEMTPPWLIGESLKLTFHQVLHDPHFPTT